MVRFWLGAAFFCASCGGVVQGSETQELSAVRPSAALDEAELRLEEEGIEDADTAIVAALLAHGFSQPDAQVLDQLGLRAQLLGSARPGATADQLFQSTMTAWEAVAAGSAEERVASVADLLGFDPQAAAVVITGEEAKTAGAHPEQGLDARGRAQVRAFRASLLLSISQHLDLPIAQATSRALPLEQLALASAARAALDFSGLPAAGRRDASRAAGRALRFAFRQWVDHARPDEAWPRVARLLGVEEPPAARNEPPDLSVVETPGLSCSFSASGLSCSGTSSGPLQLILEGQPLTVPVASGATAKEALEQLFSALPGSVAGCLIDSSADGLSAVARLDRAQPSAPDGTKLAKLSLDTSVSPPVLSGEFALTGLVPRVVLDYSENELRLLVQPVADPAGVTNFRLEVPLPKRLPHRQYELQIVEEDGSLRAAAALDRR